MVYTRPQNVVTKVLVLHSIYINWASEASPTLGCSIEISRDIYMYVCMYVCIYVGRYVFDCLWETIQNKMLSRARDPRANGAWLSKLTE